jgi:hypothetical protein
LTAKPVMVVAPERPAAMEVTLLRSTLTSSPRAFEEAINGQGRSGKRNWGRPERWQHVGAAERFGFVRVCKHRRKEGGCGEMELAVTFHSLGKVYLTLRG